VHSIVAYGVIFWGIHPAVMIFLNYRKG